MSNKLVSANILGFNMKGFLSRSIRSLENQSYKPIEINYIDNNSEDGSISFVSENFPSVRIIRNSKNLGYSGGHNAGIKSSSGDYVMLLNADIELDQNCILERVKSIEREEMIGMADGKLYRVSPLFDEKSSRVIDSCGLYLTKARKNYELRSGEIDNFCDDEKESFIFGPFGASPMYKRKMLEEIKIDGEYLDEDFFLTREEVDLAWRAQLLGYKCIYNPRSIGYHVHTYTRESRKGMPESQKKMQFRNRYLLIVKNDSITNILKDLHHILFYEILAFFFAIAREPFLFSSYIDAMRLLPKMRRKRRLIQQRVVVSNKYIRNLFQLNGT